MQKALVVGWARTDPEGASAWILSQTDTIEQQHMIRVAAGALQWMDPEKASHVVIKLAPGPARENALKELIDGWMTSDATAALAFIRTLPELDQHRLQVPMVHALIRSDPNEAIAFLKDHPIDDPIHGVAGNLARAIADRSSPEKALEWARTLEDDASRLQAFPEIFHSMAVQDPAGASRSVLDLPPGGCREESVARIGGTWAQSHFDDALEWARGLTDQDRESALSAVLTQGAPHQPAAAASQYRELLAEMTTGARLTDSLANAAATIARAYFAEDQTKAAAWVVSLPQDDARAAAARSLAEHWSLYDAPTASEWIATLPEGKTRDQAAGSLVNRIAASDPAMAFEWAGSVLDSGTRESALKTTFQAWHKLDSDAARAAVISSDWPEEEKTRWLDQLR